MEYASHGTPTRSPLMTPIEPAKINMSARPMTSQHITQQIIQQQQQHSRMNQSMESLEKQRVMQQLDKKHYETVAAIVQANQLNPSSMNMMQQHNHTINHTKSMDYSR
jgi:1,6-anhydro-N-acetylmuramate kinase